jgi:hypothetical protein
MKSKYALMVFVIFLLFGGSTNEVQGGNTMTISEEVEQIRSTDVSHVDPAAVPDGEYTGEFPFRQRYL